VRVPAAAEAHEAGEVRGAGEVREAGEVRDAGEVREAGEARGLHGDRSGAVCQSPVEFAAIVLSGTNFRGIVRNRTIIQFSSEP
jgi:hypothetical protein